MNSKLIFVIFLALIILVSGCTQPTGEQQKKDGEFDQKAKDPNIVRVIEFCEKHEDKGLIADCLSHIALETNNVNLCDEIDYSDSYINYKDACFFQFANLTRNKSYCDKLDSLKYFCYAKVTGDQKYCDDYEKRLRETGELKELEIKNKKEGCLEETLSFVNNISQCNKYDGFYYFMCINAQIKSIEDEAICLKLKEFSSNQELQDYNKKRGVWKVDGRDYISRTIDECYYNLAINSDKENYCSKIIDEYDLNECLWKIRRDLNMCKDLKNTRNLNYSAYCYSYFAEKINAPELCEKLSGYMTESETKREKAYCYKKALMNETALTSFCDESLDLLEYAKEPCLMRLAELKKDKTLCLQLESDNKDNCLYSIFKELTETDCELFYKPSNKDMCYYNFKKCDKIKEEYLKGECEIIISFK